MRAASILKTPVIICGVIKIVDTQVTIGDMASTRKLCEPVLMAVDDLAPSTLEGRFDFVLSADKLPTLVVSSDKQVSRFVAIAK